MRAAERQQEVIKRVIIRQIDEGHLRAQIVVVCLEELVIPYREVEEVTLLDARWIVVVILSAWRRYLSEGRAELRCQTGERQRNGRSCMHAIASEAGLEFLVGGKWDSESYLS